MLTSLSIKNYALIDDLNMSFSNGLSIITGETGAGKSILLGGLSLILGKRADLGAIKDGSKKCIIEGVFDVSNYGLNTFFSDHGLDFEDDCILRREISPSGKSRAFVNDTPVNLQILQELGIRLLDIHSQHQTLQLTDDEFQFQLIDALAKNADHLASYKVDLQRYKALTNELDLLQNKKSELIKEYDYNSFLLNELSGVPLEDINLEALEEETQTMSNIETIQEKLGAAHTFLSEDELGTVNSLSEAKINLLRIVAFNKNYQILSDRLESVSLELDDIVSELEDSIGALESNPSRLEEINQKLSMINGLLHKHQVQAISELIEIRTRLEDKLTDSDDIDKAIQNIEGQLNSLKIQLHQTASKISEKRVEIIPKLISQLQEILNKLGMPISRFLIEISRTDYFLINGMDILKFEFSANKGGNFNELKKAASGGELSRIMLAIKFIISKHIHLPTIIFDEIDTGVSGEISNKMASIMQEMSQDMQVFSITHLPQIAAKGDHHYKVFKKVENNKTNTYLIKLNEEQRVVEIAGMLSGSQVSDSAIAHAKELLN